MASTAFRTARWRRIIHRLGRTKRPPPTMDPMDQNGHRQALTIAHFSHAACAMGVIQADPGGLRNKSRRGCGAENVMRSDMTMRGRNVLDGRQTVDI